jgi:hypothetical protein
MAPTPTLVDVTPETINSPRSVKVHQGRAVRDPKDLVSTGAPYKPAPPQKKAWHTISPKKKLQIIQHLLHERIEEPEVRQGLKQKQRCLAGLEWDGWWRPWTAEETGLHFKVPPRTIREIWYKRHSIVQSSRSCRRDTSGAKPEQHPELEVAPGAS